jgi:hypothetical protein
VAVCWQVVQLQAAVIGEMRSLVEKETEGPKAQEGAASSHIMQLLTKKGLFAVKQGHLIRV